MTGGESAVLIIHASQHKVLTLSIYLFIYLFKVRLWLERKY